MLIALTALLVAANLIFAARELNVVRRSRASISTRTPAADLPSLSIIVPARNEQRQIERCLRSLLATRHPRYEVIVVDDQSTDETRAIADRIAASETRFTVVAGAPLPEGWVGKPWALAQGTRVARGAWLLFTDADTEHHPLAAAAALDCALNGGYDAVSLLTQQLTAGIAERLFLPTILLVIMLGVGALDDVNDPRKRDVALFNGQYILVSRRAYDAIGGHAAVRGEIAEDLELARLFKRDGRFRTFLAACDGLVRTRMYRSFGELWQGFVKNFGLAARGHAPEVIAGVALLTCVSIVSPALLLVLVLNHAWIAAVALALSMASIVAIAESGMRAMRFRPGSGLALPLGLALTLAIFGTSLFLMRCGGGVAWRGRRYGGVFRQPR